MAHLKRYASASVLLLVLATAPIQGSCDMLAPPSEPMAGSASTPPLGTSHTPPPAVNHKPFQPSTPETSGPMLPPLEPTPLSPSKPSLTGLERHPPQAAATAAETGQGEHTRQAAETSAKRSEDPRLYRNLDWNYCGPKPGVTKLNVTEPFRGDKRTPIDITADLVNYDRNTDLIQLHGGIEIIQDDRRIEADDSSYARDSGELTASGRVYMEASGLRLIGDAVEYNLSSKRGSLDNVGYRMSGNANLRGSAEQAWMLDPERTRYQDILYTTCPPGNADWSIKASTLELDQGRGVGIARNARIRILDIPVLYSPYLRFPIDGRRRSGFLIPTFGSSNETGTDISLPYYWNIAPNMDATLTPRIMSSRGLMLGTQFRYLSPLQQFDINSELLPNDQQNKDAGVRGALRVEQIGHLGSHWSSSVDYAQVSDDTYLADFGNRLDVTSVRNLSQRADVNYFGDGWRLLGRFQQFQTVDSSIAPANRPYGQLPHIELHTNPGTWNQLLEYRFEGQYDYFDHNAAVHGSRLVAIPSLRLPIRRGFGYLIPRLQLYYTGYDLIDQSAGKPTQPSHLIPSLDLDSKLIFEREIRWLGTHALQTLEPRLYYVLTSYEDQSANPQFDTTALDFSFSSLFRPKRFTGYDRIGDENRLTLGLTSRTIANRSGEELFRASVGQVYYFDQRRVQLSGNSVDSDISSSLAGELSAKVLKDWTALASLQWNPNQTDQPWEKQVFQLRYAPDKDHRLNLAYRYNLGSQASEEYEDTDISFQMPLSSRVRLVGRWLYSMLNNETIEAFAGIEVGRCCWRLRLLGEHLKRSSDNPGSTSIMLQLELAGLGSFGNQIDKLLERGIYGYQSD